MLQQVVQVAPLHLQSKALLISGKSQNMQNLSARTCEESWKGPEIGQAILVFIGPVMKCIQRDLAPLHHRLRPQVKRSMPGIPAVCSEAMDPSVPPRPFVHTAKHQMPTGQVQTQ